MKRFLMIVSVLVLSLFFAGGLQGKTFTQEDVLDIYAAVGKKLGKEGSLSHEINTTKHNHFKWTWEIHYIILSKKGCGVSVAYYRGQSSGGHTVVVYQFIDGDFDGVLESARRRQYTTFEDEDGHNIFVLPNYPQELLDKINEWALNISDAQERYEAELELWENRLQ